MALQIGGQDYTKAAIAEQLQALFNLPRVHYCLPDETSFCQVLNKKTFLREHVNFITTGEYARCDSTQKKPYIASLGTTSCLQFTIVNHVSQEFIHCHYNCAFKPAWLELVNLFDDKTHLQMNILGGNTFLNREGTKHNISMLNLAALVESLTDFLKNHHYIINLSAQMVMHHNQIWAPIANYRASPAQFSPTLPRIHQQRIVQLQKNIAYQGVIPAELMKDVIVEFSLEKNALLYHVVFPLALQENDFIGVERTTREWVAYLRQYEGEKLALLVIDDQQPLLDPSLTGIMSLVDFSVRFKLPIELIKQQVERYEAIFNEWTHADATRQKLIASRLKCSLARLQSRHQEWQFLKTLHVS